MQVLTCPTCGCDLSPAGISAGSGETCPRCGNSVSATPASAAPGGDTCVIAPQQSDTSAATPERLHPLQDDKSEIQIRPTKAPAPAPTSPPGDRFDFLRPPNGAPGLGWLGPYRVDRLLGSGGMGLVFQAEDPELQRTVALKVVRPEMAHDQELRQRFLREARTMASVKSDHIVTVFQVGQDNNLPFLAMELLEGESLGDALEVTPRPSLDFVIRVGREVALGLAAAHERGLVHRDIKPANIFLEAPSGRAKILDFGLARRSLGQSDLTQPGLIVGTPEYMAPEQAEGEEVTERSDLFSLGSVLYRLLSGTKPFGGTSTLAVLRAVTTSNPPPLHTLNQTIPLPLAELVTRLLAKSPAARPASAREVADALLAIARTLGLPSAPEETLAPVTRPVAKRPRRLAPVVWATLAVLLVAAGLVGAFFLMGNRTSGTSPAVAERSGPETSSAAKVTVPTRPRKETGPATAPPVMTYTLNGGGSTLISPLLEKWTDAYRKEKNVKVNYLTLGSSAGIQQLTSLTLDFACSEAPLTEEQLKLARDAGGDVMYVPVALGGIVPAYNLNGVAKPLRLSGPVLAGIYLGDIKKWNDPAVAEINPGVDLPALDIAVIHRADGSGSTYVFTEFLSKVSKSWQSKIGTGAAVKWPVGTGARGNEGMVEALKKKPGAIAYVELLHALQSKLSYGSVKNKAGNYILASLESVVATAEGAADDMPPDLRLSLTYRPGKDGYPICGCTFAVIYAKQPDGKGQRLVEFLRWVTQEGQEYNTDLYYARVPPSLAERVEKRLKDVKFGD
jgi:phosphate transport system substrate-binding protein